MAKFCITCGKALQDGDTFCSNCGAGQLPSAPQQYAPPQYASQQYAPPQTAPQQPEATPTYGVPQHTPLHPKQSKLGLVAIITAAAVVVICVGSYFLFFAGRQAPAETEFKPSTIAEGVMTEPSPAQASSAPATEQTPTVQPSPSDTVETVSAQTITIDIAYDSGEGVYTGEVKDGVPHGNGSFEMVTSDNGEVWTYDGQWENGDIIGEGTLSLGTFVYAGTFRGGLLNGSCEIIDNGILRYKGMCADGKLHGQGALHTKSGRLVFEGMFENDMLVESATDRQARGEAFIPECDDMDELLYDGCIAEDNTFDYPVAVWGFPIAMGEQTRDGLIVIGHMGDDAYPICLAYHYGVDETKMPSDDWLNAWGVAVGIYEYEAANGIMVTCPLVEVIYWNNAQEGM